MVTSSRRLAGAAGYETADKLPDNALHRLFSAASNETILGSVPRCSGHELITKESNADFLNSFMSAFIQDRSNRLCIYWSRIPY